MSGFAKISVIIFQCLFTRRVKTLIGGLLIFFVDFRIVFYNTIWLIVDGKIKEEEILSPLSHVLVSLAYVVMVCKMKM